ncbi:MAG: hypothetical protein WCK96_18345 [Methylococcales bacterium]
MSKSISASVGKNGANKPNDVTTVQELLNKVPITHGRPLPPLEVDGVCGNVTRTAIGNFQKIGCGFEWPDQLISVGGRTWDRLLALTEGATGVDMIYTPPTLNTVPYFGIDSYIPANNTQYLGGGKTFYDAVSNKLKTPITFWGRYIGASNPLNNDEVNYLHQKDKDCKVLVIYNGNSVASVANTCDTAAQPDISKAIMAAEHIGIPLHVTIYANIDSAKTPMNPSVEWLAGWLMGMINQRGSAGLYMGLDISTNYCKALQGLAPDIKQKIFLMLGKIVTEPGCHSGGAHVKQDIMARQIFHIKDDGYACVDVDSASGIGRSHMW